MVSAKKWLTDISASTAVTNLGSAIESNNQFQRHKEIPQAFSPMRGHVSTLRPVTHSIMEVCQLAFVYSIWSSSLITENLTCVLGSAAHGVWFLKLTFWEQWRMGMETHPSHNAQTEYASEGQEN